MSVQICLLLTIRTVYIKKLNLDSIGLKTNSFLYFPFIKWPTDNILTLCITTSVILISIYTLFIGLGNAALHIWDEAIYANNALEMALHGDVWVLKVDGTSNLYNTKPPLVIWIQALMIQLFGPSMWAIRIPSALSSLGVVLMLLWFSKRSLGDIRIGWIASLVLISSIGYVRYHMTRTGDLDATLVFWTTATTLLCFHFFIHLKRPKILMVIAFCILMGYLTKSTAALIPLAGIFVGSFYMGRIKEILKLNHFYTSTLCVISVILGYYLWREHLDAGYVSKVWHSEFQRLTDNIMPWHTKPLWFYFKKLWVDQYFMSYIYLLPFIIIPLLWGSKLIKHISFLILAFVASYLLLISYPHTKIAWYLGPLYPIMSLGTGVVVMFILNKISGLWPNVNGLWLLGLPALYIILFPLQSVWVQNEDDKPRSPLERPGHAIEILKQESPGFKEYDIVMLTDRARHKDQARYYIKSFNHFNGYELQLVSNLSQIDLTRNIIICQQEYLEQVSTTYDVEKVRDVGSCQLYLINKKRP